MAADVDRAQLTVVPPPTDGHDVWLTARVDEYVLLIHPLVLRFGRRLFTDGGAFAALRLGDIKTTTAGVVIATYQPAEPAEQSR